MSKIFFRVYTKAVRGGFIRALGKERWTALCVLASYMDEEGKCYPTQDQLAEDLGINRTSVNRLIKSLREFEWNSQPVITVIQHDNGKGFRKNNEYRILANPYIQKFGEREESPPMCSESDSPMCNESDTNNISPVTTPDEPLFNNGNDVVKYFARKYRGKYNVNYSISWQRDTALGKKLLANFGQEQAKDIIDVVFAEYEDRWKKDKYPRPTLGALVSWMANEALALVDKVKAQEARLEAARSEPRQDVDKVIQLLDRKKVKQPWAV